MEKLIGKDLAGYKIINATEVYMANDIGGHVSTIAYLKDGMQAHGLAGLQSTNNRRRMRMVLVLTNGLSGILLNGDHKEITFLENEEEFVRENRAPKELT